MTNAQIILLKKCLDKARADLKESRRQIAQFFVTVTDKECLIDTLYMRVHNLRVDIQNWQTKFDRVDDELKAIREKADR